MLLLMWIILNSQLLITFIILSALSTFRFSIHFIMLVFFCNTLMILLHLQILLLIVLMLIRINTCSLSFVASLPWMTLLHVHAKFANLLHFFLTLSHFTSTNFLEKLSGLYTRIHFAEK